MNADGIDGLGSPEIDDHPLRMGVSGSPVKWESRYGLLFQNEFYIAVCDTRITVIVCLVDRVSAPWQTIAIGNVNRFAEGIVRGPVSAFVTRIAPRAARIPMPRPRHQAPCATDTLVVRARLITFP